MKANHLLLFLFLFLMSVPACSQTQNKDNKIVLNKTFRTSVGSMCVETNQPKPCAGYTVFLELNFKNDLVLVNEKNENECGVISENKYKTNYSIQGNIVKVEKLTRYGEPLNIKQFLYVKNSLIGKTIEVDRVEKEYVFEEIKIK
ncbi:hypothetical protein NG800_015080 [Epilithonimonas ginsengisoli]|uniref:Lipoprotein n=1 Tax=Epilithonimonas ginsengisoli TaxID=1245592 RepID=A0ABU4JKQ1_9FLAO|nr:MULTISPECIES: hypothetical protein [Chryseobacterium group]MBV6881283.1 hypothetical protein [Epilithonimonas sp. FP105]MDW8550250.1 hypothetical protein [Epilithonimonas ginsengisoli]OAH69333.1 hypothetical protein AXA65_14940 [Chryseobacterium sp. FP211-J200]